MQWCDDVLHVFTHHRELLPSSLFIKSQQKLLRKPKDFSSTVVTCIPEAAIFTFKQKNPHLALSYTNREVYLGCFACAAAPLQMPQSCSVGLWGTGQPRDAMQRHSLLFFPKWFVLKCSREVSLHLHQREPSTSQEKKMTGAPPALQRTGFLPPWTYCINNWQYPEVSGAAQGHTRSWEPGSHRALSCTLSPRSQHPHAPGSTHPSLPQPVLLMPCTATSLGAFSSAPWDPIALI